MVKRYTKKPIHVFEAIRFERGSWGCIVVFTGGKAHSITSPAVAEVKTTCFIDSPAGTLVATEGDYIVKDVMGNFYPCKPDLFERTFQEVL